VIAARPGAILPSRHMDIQELDTPAVIVDLDVMERNLAQMAEYTKSKRIALRPHTKTHKNSEIANLQIGGGAVGVTVAKPGEARVMVTGGVGDLMIAYPLVTPPKAQTAAELAGECKLTISLDSKEAIDVLADAVSRTGDPIDVLVEIDVGFRRCGVALPEQAVQLARQALRSPKLNFCGLMFYPGNLAKPPAEQPPLIAEVNRTLAQFYEAFQKEQIEIPVISGGSTPTALRSHLFDGVTEIRPGMYLFNDGNLVKMGICPLEDCALHVLVTVASTAVPGRAIIDGGSKTFSSDRARGDKATFGTIREDPEADFVALSEEHGHLDLSRATRQYRVGDRLRILPNHVCATVNMHDRIYGIRGTKIERVWAVEARGKVQ
jgi:D-serine deaminase-like pyridoxal phosphate-dependent protein